MLGHNTGLCPVLVIIQAGLGGWGYRQEWQQLAMPPAALTGLGLAATTVAGPHDGVSHLCHGARRGWERVHPEEECGLGGAVVSAGALRMQPAVQQQPPRSMAEKPQIQLFIKVRGGPQISAPGHW